jgi:hypothetical protein
MRNRRADALGGAKPSKAAKRLADTLKEEMDPRIRGANAGTHLFLEQHR